METKKFYATPETEVFTIQAENMCQASVDIKGELEEGITGGNSANGRDLADDLLGIGDLW